MNSPPDDANRRSQRRRAKELHGILVGDHHRRPLGRRVLVDYPSRRPGGVAIEKHPDDSAAQDTRVRPVLRFGPPLRNDQVAVDEAAQAEALLVGRSASEALVGWIELLLEAEARHLRIVGECDLCGQRHAWSQSWYPRDDLDESRSHLSSSGARRHHRAPDQIESRVIALRACSDSIRTPKMRLPNRSSLVMPLCQR